MSNTNIPTKINIISRSENMAQLTWKLSKTDGHETIIYSATSTTATFTEEKRVPSQTKAVFVSGSGIRVYKMKTLDLGGNLLSDFSEIKTINYNTNGSFDHSAELESNGSTIHRTFNIAPVAIDNSANWTDIWVAIDIPNFRKLKQFIYTVVGAPVNLQMRLVEKTLEMNDFAEKLPPEGLTNGVSKSIVFSAPKPQVQKSSDIKLQVRADLGSAIGATFELNEIEVVDYTLGSL